MRGMRGVVEELAGYGCCVLGSIQDNGANVKKAANIVFPVVANCGAHSGNLLLEDYGDVYRRQFDQCTSVQQFFTNRHRACSLYAELRKVCPS